MSESFVNLPAALRRPVYLGVRAAGTLVDELARLGGPKTGLLIGAGAGSPVLAAAVDALMPDDRLVVVGDEAMRAHVGSQGSWVTSRVSVIDSLGAADPADVVIYAQPLTGTAEQTRSLLEDLGKRVNDGGVLAVVVPATSRPSGAVDEIERQVALYGVGSDLVLRNVPPVRVHRLRFSAVDHAVAQRLAPAVRPSSVRLTRGMNIDSNGVAAAG